MHCLFKRIAIPCLLAGACMVALGCGPYSFSGSSLPHIKTIAIPLFNDKTAEFGVKEQITNEIIAAFNRDNTLKIADRRAADSILEGTLISVTERPGAYNKQESVQEIQLFITVEIHYRDLKKREIVWEDTIAQFGTYAPADPQRSTREAAISEAIEKIAEDVLNRTVSGW